MNRRGFIKSLFAVTASAAAITAVGPIVRSMVSSGVMASPFVLYGDGVTDDTQAIQALIDGEIVYTADGRRLQREFISGNSVVYLPRGTYRVGEIALGKNAIGIKYPVSFVSF